MSTHLAVCNKYNQLNIKIHICMIEEELGKEKREEKKFHYPTGPLTYHGVSNKIGR